MDMRLPSTDVPRYPGTINHKPRKSQSCLLLFGCKEKRRLVCEGMEMGEEWRKASEEKSCGGRSNFKANGMKVGRVGWENERC